jgi:Ca2+-binding RTX toxin-like protein
VLKINNTLQALGGDGNDKITGLAGYWLYDGQVDGGSGDDKIDVTAPLNDLFVLGGEGNDTASGAASQGQLQIDGGAGHDTVWGYQLGAGHDMTLAGGDGNDTVSGIASNSATLSGGEGDDRVSFTGSGFSFGHVSGDAGNDTLSASHGMDTLAGGVGDDLFLLSAKEILWQDMIYTADFESGHDRLSVSQSTLAVGDGDLQVDGAVTIDGSGGFDAGAELVIVAADIFGDLTLDKAAAAIGNATQDYVAGQSVVFMVDNGVDSWALHFTSAGGDATVSASELSVIARLTGTSSTGAEDVVWGT